MSAKSPARKAMDDALKAVFVKELRDLGWRGSLPHLHRIGADRTDYLTVQQNRAGGSFVVEIVSGGPDGLPEGPFKDLPAEKLKVSHFRPFDRLRLGSDPARGEYENWYAYSDRQLDQEALLADPMDIAARVLADYHAQAEAHLSGAPVPPPVR